MVTPLASPGSEVCCELALPLDLSGGRPAPAKYAFGDASQSDIIGAAAQQLQVQKLPTTHLERSPSEHTVSVELL